MITPVFTQTKKLIGYVANRAHHAEIGGIKPGSMPPMATRLAEEGIVIPPTYIVRQGVANWSEIREILSNSKYPSRAVEENIADLRAAVASNHKGAQQLLFLTETAHSQLPNLQRLPMVLEQFLLRSQLLHQKSLL